MINYFHESYRHYFMSTFHLRTASFGVIPLLLIIEACSFFEKYEKKVETVGNSNSISIDVDDFKSALRQLLVNHRDMFQSRRFRLSYGDTLARFYAKRDFEPKWIRTGVVSGEINSILAFIKQSDEHGFDPRWYHYSELEKGITEFISSLTDNSQPPYDALANIEVMLSDAVLGYARDLRGGILNPKQLDPDAYHLPYRKSSDIDLLEPLTVRDIDEYLRSIQPFGTRYIQLQHALKHYARLAAESGWQPIPQIHSKITLGDKSPILNAVARRLIQTNSSNWIPSSLSLFFPALRIPSLREVQFAKFDWEKINAGRYDTTLFKAVQQFQRDNGLLDDGAIGKKTIDNLNTTLDERILQIKLNLDRYRWFQYPDTGRYLRVNIPEYYVYAMNQGRVEIKMKVCVGEKFRGWRIHGHQPMSYETPLLHGELSYLVLNPTWNVPHSIAVREMYYEASKDPTYLLRHNYRVYQGDSLVSPVSIDWSTYSAEKIPFRFVQEAGRGNALGKIKFMFYNDFDVYLHDTPKRVPFTRSARAVSHGCVRVEEPMALVRYVLRDHSTWNVGKIQVYLAGSREGKVVFLDKKIPIYLDYVTAWVDDEGRIQFRDDIYSKDQILRTAYRALDSLRRASTQ